MPIALLRNYPPVLGLCELCAALATFAVKAFDLRHKFLSWRRRALRYTIRDFSQLRQLFRHFTLQ